MERDSVVTVQFFHTATNGLPQAAAGRDQLATSVTPIVNFLDITTRGAQGVELIQGPDPTNQNVIVTVGIRTVGQNNNLAAVFDAQVRRVGINGELFFVQNSGVIGGVESLVNGVAGGPANGWTFTQASNRLARDTQLIDPATNVRVFRVLDMSEGQVPGNPLPGPDYRGLFRVVPTGNQELLQITAQDGPFQTLTTLANGQIQLDFDSVRDLERISYQMNFRMYLAWRFPQDARGDSIICTLASRDWNVIFRADTHVAGRGVTAIGAGAGVFVPQQVDRANHVDPIVIRPTFNESVRVQ